MKTHIKQAKLDNPITKATNTIELCVICGEKTDYEQETPIDKRLGYIEGAGQLCRKCYVDTYCNANYQGDT